MTANTAARFPAGKGWLSGCAQARSDSHSQAFRRRFPTRVKGTERRTRQLAEEAAYWLFSLRPRPRLALGLAHRPNTLFATRGVQPHTAAQPMCTALVGGAAALGPLARASW